MNKTDLDMAVFGGLQTGSSFEDVMERLHLTREQYDGYLQRHPRRAHALRMKMLCPTPLALMTPREKEMEETIQRRILDEAKPPSLRRKVRQMLCSAIFG